MGFVTNKAPAEYEAIHRTLLSGLLSNIATQYERKEYLGARNRKLYVFPGSGLYKKPPKWLVAAEMIETSRLFSHHNARIDPDWLSSLAAHLVKKTYSEPHYSVRNGQVMAYEKQTLYGLPIVEKRACSYGKIDPTICREIFIRSALVEGEYRGKGAFFTHNKALQVDLEEIESRTRRRDVLVDDQVMFDFYNERIPQEVMNLAGFEHWRKQQEQHTPDLLYMDVELLSQRDSDALDQSQFPDHLEWQGTHYPLSYHFEPGHEEDGVTVTIPVSILHQVPLHRFDWLVPGMLRDKCIALVKALPKSLRRNFVPVPNYVDKALLSLKPADTPLVEALGLQLKGQTGVVISSDLWQKVVIEDIYYLNIKLIDENGQLLAMSRNLADLKAKYRGRVTETLAQSQTETIEREGIECWDFDTLPEIFSLQQQGLTIRTYPALVVDQNQINLKLLDNADVAQNKTTDGLNKLYQRIYPESGKYLKKHLLKGQDLQLKSALLPSKETLIPTIIDAAYYQSLLNEQTIPRCLSDFEARYVDGKGQIVSIANELEAMLISWLPLLSDIRKGLKKQGLASMHGVTDINGQLEALFPPDFMYRVPMPWLRHYQRYLKAIVTRLEKLPINPTKDREQVLVLEKLSQRLMMLESQWDELSAPVRDEVWTHRFMLQEYRVSLFSQQLKTAFPISDKRINSHWKTLSSMVGH
jgi:ATP-dependent helicase HrpA